MSKQRLILLSFSQISKTQSSDVSISAFAEKTGLNTSYVKAMMAYDQYIAPCVPCSGGSYISGYKSANINDEEFCAGIRIRLGRTQDQLSDEDVKKCWNAMCEFTPQSNEEINKFIDFMEQNKNYQVVFVNDTNRMQHEFNIEQFNNIVGNKPDVLERMSFVNSYEKRIKGKQELAREGVFGLQNNKKIAYDRDIEAIVSFHNEMPSESILMEGEHARSASKRLYSDIKTTSESSISELITKLHLSIEAGLETKTIS